MTMQDLLWSRVHDGFISKSLAARMEFAMDRVGALRCSPEVFVQRYDQIWLAQVIGWGRAPRVALTESLASRGLTWKETGLRPRDLAERIRLVSQWRAER